MLSFLTLPFLASAALGASHLPRRDFHHNLARDISATASVTNTTTSANASVDMIAAAYYAGWHGVGNDFYNFTLQDVAWTKYTHLIYAFAVTDPAAPENATLADSDETLLTQFVANAKNNSVKAMLSIGGWTGGRAFSTNVGSEANRTAFVKTVVDLKNKYQLDGIDFDWEYPNDAGIGCNAISPNDTANFLTFLQALRADPDGKDLILSAATPVLPWKDATGSPSTDVSGFAKVLDFITVMNYDVWGSWSTGVGPNAPLNDTCASAANQQGSAVSAVKAWTAAGMPAHQIVLGVASYGHSFTVTPSNAFTSSDDNTLAAYPAFNSSSHPLGDGWDGPQGTDVCGVTDPNPSGNWDYWGLVTEGWVWPNGTARPGIDSRFDECSQTPYVYNKTSQIMVSFDDPTSWKVKGEFIVSAGLRGFNVWEAGGDFKDYLLDAISVATGMADEDDDDCGDDTSSASAVISASISVGLPASTPAITPVAGAPSGSDNDSQPPAPAPPAAGKGGVPTAPATQTTKPVAPVLANGGGKAQPSATAHTSSAAPAAPTDDGEGDDDDEDCDDDGEGDETSSASAAVSTPTPVNNSGSGDDGDDCDDTSSTSAAVSTPTPVNNAGSGGDGDDDCDDDEPSSAPAAPTAAVSSAVSSAAPTPVITSSAAAPSVSSTDGDGDDCDDMSSSASVAATSVAPSSAVSTDSASISTLASSASSSASASVSTLASAASEASSASASVSTLVSASSASSSAPDSASTSIASASSAEPISAVSSAAPSSATPDASPSSSAASASSAPTADSTPAADASSSAASTSVAPTPY